MISGRLLLPLVYSVASMIGRRTHGLIEIVLLDLKHFNTLNR